MNQRTQARVGDLFATSQVQARQTGQMLGHRTQARVADLSAPMQVQARQASQWLRVNWVQKESASGLGLQNREKP